jgi:hypothetical protein
MRKILLSFLILVSATTLFAQELTSNTAKPWAYWWWPGSAVNEADLKVNLKTYADAGFGGMHIIPIYGVKGVEEKFIPYMSDRWLDILDFTTKEAAKNDMGIDMSLGTGWPFGGSEVSVDHGAKKFEINAKNELIVSSTSQKVKRAAQGGEGLVIDHFSKEASDAYFDLFGKAFKKKNYGVRAFYNDSYEVYGANWTTDCLEKFKEFRGYDLADHYDVLALDSATTEKEKRIWADYNQTLHDLLLSTFTKSYTDFAHRFGKVARNEAHGSPANILDLYGLSDIPETEFFGSKQYDIPGYRQDEDYDPNQFGTPTEYVMKMASSPAHIIGKPLVSSETATWNANHFKGALSQIKPLIDESFVAGVNHVFYHGVPYSPPSAEFPGWLFYASTNFNQNSHFFKELPLLNRYIEVSQRRLQQSIPDNDVLVLLPFSDLWHSVGNKSKMHMVDVHNITNGGIFSEKLLKLLDDLKAAGIGYDFISDDQLYELDVVFGNQSTLRIKKGSASYKAVLIPESDYMKKTTVDRLKSFHEAHVPVVFEKNLPNKAFGWLNYGSRDMELRKTLTSMAEQASPMPLTTLASYDIKGEELGKIELDFIRKINPKGQKEYFISNLSNKTISKEVWLNVKADFFTVFNQLTEVEGFLKVLQTKKGCSLISIHLMPGQSIFITEGKNVRKEWLWLNATEEIELKGKWQIDFEEGMPIKPNSYDVKKLTSWTNAPDSNAQYWNGYAKYSIDFDMNGQNYGSSILDLGDVRETAEVWLNGINLGTVWSLPFQIEIPENLLRNKNHLELRVRNTSANYMRLLDKQKVNWKKFYDINFVDITYTPFDASKWEAIPSGLLGPVKLYFNR